MATLEGHADGVYALAALDGGRLASGSLDQMIKIYACGFNICQLTTYLL